MEMTISQALRRIKKVKGHLSEQLNRANASISYLETDLPAYKFADSLGEADKLRDELVMLETAVRLANAKATITFEGRSITLAEATAWLAEFKGRVAWLRGLNSQAKAEKSTQQNTYDQVKHEYVAVSVMMRCELPQAERDKLVEKEQSRFDALNDAVEAANHRVTVL